MCYFVIWREKLGDRILEKAREYGPVYVINVGGIASDSESEAESVNEGATDVGNALYTAIETEYLAYVEDLTKPQNKGYVNMFMMWVDAG